MAKCLTAINDKTAKNKRIKQKENDKNVAVVVQWQMIGTDHQSLNSGNKDQ